ELMKEFRKVHQFNCFSCHTPSQVGLSKFLKNKESYLSLPLFMQQKRDYFLKLMKETKFGMLESKGSYFICATYDRISNEPDKDFSIRITKEYGVTTIPVSVFYRSGTDNKFVRFCFVKMNINQPLHNYEKFDCIELERIYLVRSATGKGHGHKVVEFCFEYARKLNKQLIWLKAMDSSEAVFFYEKLGFESCGSFQLD